MPSRSSRLERNIPQQDRSSRRLDKLLDAAESVFAEVGYEAATMTTIAERAGTSIGGLYRYFPDKTAVAQALRHHYAGKIEPYWSPLIAEAKTLSVSELSRRLIDGVAQFTSDHPAYLAVLGATLKSNRSSGARQGLRLQFAEAFCAKQPSLTAERALLIANLVLEIVKGMTRLYADTAPKNRPLVTEEFKRVLEGYLGDVLK